MPTNDDLLARFNREYVQYNQISTQRAREQRKLLLEFGLRLGGPLSEATGSDLQSFAGDLLARGLHVNTVRKKLNQIRPFYSWAYAQRIVDGDAYMALKAVPNPRGSTGLSVPRPYSPAELAVMRDTVAAKFPPLPSSGPGSQALKRWLLGTGVWKERLGRHAMRLQLEAVISLALECGLRRTEIYNLTPDELHPDLRYLIVKGKRVDHRDKIREVPFTEHTRTTVAAWLDFRALIRPEHRRTWISVAPRKNRATGLPLLGVPLHLDWFAGLLSREIGPGWELHRLRHTAGTEWLRAGVPLETVSKFLGHSSLQQTLGYAEIVKSDIERSMQKHEAAFMERIQNRAA